MQSKSLEFTNLRLTAILQAVFVTILWSTSWILIKIGLRNNLPALTFAGLRYTFAFLCLIPLVAFSTDQRKAFTSLSPAAFLKLGLLGLFYYTLTQGAIFISLAYLPAALLNLMLNLTTPAVGLFGIFFLKEQLSVLQWLGVLVTTLGVGVYFLPVAISNAQIFGLFIAILCVLTNTFSTLLGRNINRSGLFSPLIITFVSMGFGSILLLGIGVLTQGSGSLSWQDWLIIAWLAIVNTAFAFTLWNHTLRTLAAVESSIINSLMMPQIAILAFFFLGETLTIKEIAGLIIVGLGVLMAQLRQKATYV